MDIKIDMHKVQKLLDSSISGPKIEEETGITKKMISKYRTGESQLLGMRIDTADKLQKLYDKLEGQEMTSTKIKGIKKAVGEFNNWQGPAIIYFDKENLSVETYVYSSPGSYQQFSNDSVVGVYQKATSSIIERDDKISMYKLQELCEDEL